MEYLYEDVYLYPSLFPHQVIFFSPSTRKVLLLLLKKEAILSHIVSLAYDTCQWKELGFLHLTHHMPMPIYFHLYC